MTDTNLADALREIVEEVVYLFDDAREAGRQNISSMVGSRFEAKARAAILRTLQSMRDK